MNKGFRLVFHGGVSSWRLPADQARAALVRMFGLNDAQFTELVTTRILYLDPTVKASAAQALVDHLQQMGLDVVLAPPTPPEQGERWLSDSGLSAGFARTNLDLQRAEALLHGTQAAARPAFDAEESADGRLPLPAAGSSLPLPPLASPKEPDSPAD